jgi:hypothetical protein
MTTKEWNYLVLFDVILILTMAAFTGDLLYKYHYPLSNLFQNNWFWSSCITMSCYLLFMLIAKKKLVRDDEVKK